MIIPEMRLVHVGQDVNLNIAMVTHQWLQNIMSPADNVYTRDKLWRDAAEKLRDLYPETAMNIAQDLYIHAENITKMDLILSPNHIVGDDIVYKYKNYIQRALLCEPVSKIIQQKDFYGTSFYVTHDTLDPRYDSEVIITAILNDFQGRYDENLRILDLGIGTGCLSVVCAKVFTKSSIIGLDISEKAVIVAMCNAVTANVAERCHFICQDMMSHHHSDYDGGYDIIISNPPYIPKDALDYLDANVLMYDPVVALDGGEDGLVFYRNIAQNITKYCKKNTFLYLEVGIGQAAYVKDIFSLYHFTAFKFHTDSAGIIRCVSCRCG